MEPLEPEHGGGLQRTNLMLTKEESEWLDGLAAEIIQAGGCKLSRSEIVRASLAGLRELCSARSGIFSDLAILKEPSSLELMTVAAARMAVTHAGCSKNESSAHHLEVSRNGNV